MAVARKIFLDRADRLQRLAVPSGALAQTAKRLQRRGVEVIDLSRLRGSILKDDSSGRRQSANSGGHRPASPDSVTGLHEAVAQWYARRFGASVDPEREIVVVPNAIIGLYLLCLAFVEAGDMVLLPDPGAAFYRGAVVLCGGGVMPYHLWERNDYLPNYSGLEQGLIGRTRMMVVSYPHNPTAAAADPGILKETVGFARRRQILVAYDGAFTYAANGSYRPPSFLDATGAKGVGVELTALGANFGLPDLPLALICGNREAIAAVSFLLEVAQLPPADAMVRHGLSLLSDAEAILSRRIERLARSREILMETMTDLGWTPRSSPTAPFLWIRVPAPVGVEAFCRRVLRRAGLLLAAGTDFGERGEGYVRMTIPEEFTLAQTVCERLRRHVKLYQRRLPRRRARGGRAETES
ncbi:MAG: aminotransferase class I/II-fold pyridoxal phosphate-dependent enzyme [candidate division Zixibacteria bacterium]|nr:aminotransferase class I/II-fold pyridoxal phosphate-dependent enzyme [candidate division Zixibacteria bacterium]